MHIPTNINCTACQTGIVHGIVVRPERPSGGRLGPPNWEQPRYNRVNGYFCNECGILYKFPPRNLEFDTAPLIAEANRKAEEAKDAAEAGE